jgi:hypothetical protein
MCVGAFSFDWRLLFNSGPSQVETTSNLPTQGVLKITIGAQASDDLVELIVRDSFGNVKKTIFLPLKVQED